MTNRGALNNRTMNINNVRNDVKEKSILCVFCGGNHLSCRCKNVTDVNTRYSIVRRDNLCFICLKRSHQSKFCRLDYNCIKCGRKHNIALCNKNVSEGSQRNEEPNERTVVNNVAHTEVVDTVNQPDADVNNFHGDILLSTTINTVNSRTNESNENSEILLQCALARVGCPGEDKFSTACALFDGCSQRTYVTNELQSKLRLSTVRTERLILRTFASPEGRVQDLKVVQLCVEGKTGAKVYIEALCVPYICSNLKIPTINWVKKEYDFLRDIELADPPSVNHKVQLLIGLDYYFNFITGKTRRGPPGGPVVYWVGWFVALCEILNV